MCVCVGGGGGVLTCENNCVSIFFPIKERIGKKTQLAHPLLLGGKTQVVSNPP